MIDPVSVTPDGHALDAEPLPIPRRLIDRAVEMEREQFALDPTWPDWIWRISTDWGWSEWAGLASRGRLLSRTVIVDRGLPPRSLVIMRERDAVAMPTEEYQRLFGIAL